MRTNAGRKPPRSTQTQLSLLSGGFEFPTSTSTIEQINRQTIELELGIVAAETWPARYKFHKYWGRKPANVVGRYIDYFSRPGEFVLDPFVGSGVTVVEAARLHRRSVGFDLNPMAVHLTNAMLSPPDLEGFQTAAEEVIRAVDDRVASLYVTQCDKCGSDATLRSIGYVDDEMREVRYRCSACRCSGTHAPNAFDLQLAQAPLDIPADAPDCEILFGWEMQKLKRRGAKNWSDLFTKRNYVTAAHLRDEILKVTNDSCRNWLLLTLTASLAQFTRMIADFSGDAGGPSWKLNCYWMPGKWQELNPLWYFENRVAKSLESIRDLSANGAPWPLGKAENVDSRTMPLANASVDYIFTDPPYGGEGIQYGELSLLWCLWLSKTQDLSSEIAFNPYRKLDQQHYSSGLARVFAECFRVLKPGKWMTVTFANKDPVVWDSLLGACRNAGFKLVTAAPMKRSAPSLTETTMHTAPKADLVLNFEKPTSTVTKMVNYGEREYSVQEAVERIVAAFKATLTRFTPHDVFDRVTVDWFSWYFENGTRPNAVQPTLANVEAQIHSMTKEQLARTDALVGSL
ncbi:MAG: hypothetical protein IPO66_16640 [Rhodanobacteraceae bacterium]|nr:hypothetical protein [Rhodanobacteraceae bacterium]